MRDSSGSKPHILTLPLYPTHFTWGRCYTMLHYLLVRRVPFWAGLQSLTIHERLRTDYSTYGKESSYTKIIYCLQASPLLLHTPWVDWMRTQIRNAAFWNYFFLLFHTTNSISSSFYTLRWISKENQIHRLTMLICCPFLDCLMGKLQRYCSYRKASHFYKVFLLAQWLLCNFYVSNKTYFAEYCKL